MTRIALNGLGRIGKQALRRMFDLGLGDQNVLLNDAAGDADQAARWVVEPGRPALLQIVERFGKDVLPRHQ